MPVLTSSIINSAEIKDKIYYIWDDMVKGFALKVIPNGQKKYVIKYRTSMGGRNAVQRWYIFGDIQSLSCKEAREEAAKLFLMIHDGKDPQEEKASLRKADTLAEFWEVFKKDYVELKENKETYLLFPEMIVETQKVTKYPYMPFWQGLFDDNEWKTIFQNLFTKKKLLPAYNSYMLQ